MIFHGQTFNPTILDLIFYFSIFQVVLLNCESFMLLVFHLAGWHHLYAYEETWNLLAIFCWPIYSLSFYASQPFEQSAWCRVGVRLSVIVKTGKLGARLSAWLSQILFLTSSLRHKRKRCHLFHLKVFIHADPIHSCRPFTKKEIWLLLPYCHLAILLSYWAKYF